MKARFTGIGKSPTWVVTLAISMAALAYVLLIFLPFQRTIAKLSRELKDKRLHVIRADQLNQPLAQEKSRLAEIREFTEQWEGFAPDPQELAGFYARISEQAREADVQLVRFEPQPPRNLRMLRQYSVALSIQGEFEQLFEFMTRIEQLPQTVWPLHVSLSQPEGGAARLQCEMTLTFFGDLADSAD